MEIIDHVKALLGHEEVVLQYFVFISWIINHSRISNWFLYTTLQASFVGECIVSCSSDIVPDTSNSSVSIVEFDFVCYDNNDSFCF